MPPTVLVSKPAKRASPWSSWTTMSPVRRSANERSRPRPRRGGPPAGAPGGGRRLGGAAAVDQRVLRDRGEPEWRGDEAVPQVGLGEDEATLLRVPACSEALEVVGGALAL